MCNAFFLMIAVSMSDLGAKGAGAAFIAAKAAEDAVIALPSGLLITVIKAGPGAKSPTTDDDCDVHYTGAFIDGLPFDSSHARGKPSTVKPHQVIAGWGEALQLMCEGDTWEVVIPHELGYGARGDLPDVPPFAALVFTMELVRVKGPGWKAGAKAAAQLRAARLRTIDGKLGARAFVGGSTPSAADARLYRDIFGGNVDVAQWAARMASYYQSERVALLNPPAPAAQAPTAAAVGGDGDDEDFNMGDFDAVFAADGAAPATVAADADDGEFNMGDFDAVFAQE
jgi:FKBP-type peptidyl-prolyl cis-trans isomerase FklB